MQRRPRTSLAGGIAADPATHPWQCRFGRRIETIQLLNESFDVLGCVKVSRGFLTTEVRVLP